MKKVFQNKNNNNFYYIKELQWTNKASKLNSQYQKLNSINTQKIDPISLQKEKTWNTRFIYSKIPSYDSTRDKNVLDPNLLKIPSKNCYYNAIKYNNMLNGIQSSKNSIRGKIPSSFHKTNEKAYLNCSAKNPNNLRIFSHTSSSKDIFMNSNHGNNRLFSPEINNNLNNIHSSMNSINSNSNKGNQNNADKLLKLWNDLCVLEPYRDLFNIILDQLSEEKKNDIYEREFNELLELKNNVQNLSMNVYYRLKTLEELNNLNDKLGLTLKSKQTSSNEVILKNISKKIENLREYTTNLCLAMRTVKEKINAGHPWGKFDMDIICEKYKFDKNYLIKMKEEMCVLREGYAKYFFNIGDDNTPFLLNASEPKNKNNKNFDPFMHLVPLSNELKENINQSIYIIYQELIGYQNDMVFQNKFRNISPLKKYKYNEKDIKNFKSQNEHYNSNKSSMINNINNNNLWLKNKEISPARTFNPEQIKSVNYINEVNNKRILSGGENMGNNEFCKYFNNKNSNNYKYKFNEKENQNENNNLKDNKEDMENYEDDKNNINNNIDNYEFNKERNNNKIEYEKDISNNNDIKEENYYDNNTNDLNEAKNFNNNENKKDNKITIKKYEKIINKKNKKEENKNNNLNDDIDKKDNKNNIEYKNNEEDEVKKIDINNNEITNKKIEYEKEKNNIYNKEEEYKNNDNNNDNINNIEIKSQNNNNINNENKCTENNTTNGMNNINNTNSNNDKSNTNDKQENNDSNNLNTNNRNQNIDNKNNEETNIDNLTNINIYDKKEYNNENSNEKDIQLNGIKQNTNNEKDNLSIHDDKNNNLNTEKEENQNLSNIDNNNVSKISKTSEKNKISEFLKSKNLKVKTYTEDINNFSKDFYDTYYQLIPFQIKEMFRTKNNIVPNLLKGISPYLIILFEEFPGEQNNWLNLRNNIFGICTINYELKKNKLKININHISTSIEFNQEKNKYYLNDIKHIFDLIIKYIKNEFYFDEIILEYDTNKTNEDILNIFLNDFNFSMVSDTDIEDNEEDENTDNNKIKEEQENKLVYVNDSMKNEINDMIRQAAPTYLGNNIFTIFNSMLITNNFNNSPSMNQDTNRSYHHYNTHINKFNKTYGLKNKFDDSLINLNTMDYLLEVKEAKNIKILYNKITKLDQLIKVYQNYKIKKDEIPITIAQNIFDILSCAINKNIVNNYFNNTYFFNNYNTNNPSSYFDKDSGFFYNYIKPEKIYVFQNEKYRMKFYQIINNNISLFFSNINNDILKYLGNNSIYLQMNEIYKESINNKKEILNDKIIWIPCFEVYNHYKCLSNNGVGTIHEYVKLSNKKIKKMNYENFRINNNKNNYSQVKIIPDTSRDILFSDDFIMGLINNCAVLIDENKYNNSNNKENDMPYIIFLSYVYKNNFIGKVGK